MLEKAGKALSMTDQLTKLVKEMIPGSRDLDLQRLLKQIDADLMDVKHKLSLVAKLAGNGT